MKIVDPSTPAPGGGHYSDVTYTPPLSPGRSFEAVLYLPYWIFNHNASLEVEADYRNQVREKREDNNTKSYFRLG